MSDLQRWSIGIDQEGVYQCHADNGHWVEYDKAADLIEQQQQQIAEMEAQLFKSDKLYQEAHLDACFYKSCALSGEFPKEGSQPSAQPPKGEENE